ncbi:MAG: murein biosynthesis integral membrane protein MurJ [Gemmatimonadota bacterium]
MTSRDSDGRAALSVGAGIFLSKILGFVRERVFAHYFGVGTVSDAWWTALKIPNVVRNLLGEGTLSASMIPVYAEFLEEGRDEEAARFAGAALGILTALAGGVALLGGVLAPQIVGLLFSKFDPETQALTATLIRILFPMTGLFVISAWSLGILNSHRTFFISYVAPVLWNVSMIVAMIGGATYWGLGGEPERLVVALGWGALVGGVLTLLIQLPWLLPHLNGVRVSLGRGVAGVREAVQAFIPVVAARGVVNLSSAIDLFLAARLTAGAVSLMGFAQTLANLPIALFGTGIAAAELPEMSRMRGEDAELLARRVRTSAERALWFLIPSAVGYVIVGDVIVGSLYQTGAFGPAEVLITWGVLSAYTLGLPASASSRVLSSAFYALRDTKTPANAAYVRVALSIGIGVALMGPADELGFGMLRLGAAGLALGSATGAWIEYGLLTRALGRAIGRHRPSAASVLRMILASVLAAAVGVGVQLVLPWSHPLIVGTATLVPFAVAYLGAASLLGHPLPIRR